MIDKPTRRHAVMSGQAVLVALARAPFRPRQSIRIFAPGGITDLMA